MDEIWTPEKYKSKAKVYKWSLVLTSTPPLFLPLDNSITQFTAHTSA
jgi:hypothetical protein